MAKIAAFARCRNDSRPLFQALSALAPKNCVVLGGKGDGHTAILEVEATMMGSKARAPVTMTKEGDAWKVKETGGWVSK